MQDPTQQSTQQTAQQRLATRTLRIGSINAPVSTTITESDGVIPEAVFFVHGNPGSRLDWEALATAVMPHLPVAAPDMPGFGRADKPRDFPYSVETGAGFIEHLRRRLQVEKVHLVLHDFGGPWGLQWAADYPRQVASITLMDTGIMPGYRWHALARLWRTPLLGELFQRITNYSGFRLILNRANPRPLPETFIRQMYDHMDAGTRRAILRLYRATPEPGRHSEALGQVLARLKLPVLVIWGEADPYLPVSYAQHQATVFTGARVVEIAGAGHWPFVEQPERVSGELVKFLLAVKQQVMEPAEA